MEDAVIYNRTSTEEQNPENQLNDCKSIINKLGIINYEVLNEKQSAFKDIDRPIFDSIFKEIKRGNIKIFIVWDLDRIYRNRIKLKSFFELCKINKCKIYSFRQEWLNDINKIPEPWNEIVLDLLVSILGYVAEDESKKKSDRVKAAQVIGEDGVLRSKNGKVWGRKILDEKVNNKIIELFNSGLSMKKISMEVYYWDRNKNKKNVSVGYVHKIISNYKKRS